MINDNYRLDLNHLLLGIFRIYCNYLHILVSLLYWQGETYLYRRKALPAPET